jgi:NodT family efflux transporter outer membrane factor (OMF) lipoprotein
MKLGLFFSIIGLIVLPGCMIGPRVQQPFVNLPNKFSATQTQSDAVNLDEWWTFFNDPVLNKLISLGIDNNYDLKIACEKIEQTRAQYGIRAADLYPLIQINGIANRARNLIALNQTIDIPATTAYNYFQLGFDAVWELDVWGKLRHARNAAYFDYLSQIELTRDVYVMLLGEIAKTYIDAQTFRTQMHLLKEQTAVDMKILSLTSDQFQSGIESIIPTAQQEARLAQTGDIFIQYNLAFKESVIKLATLLGKNPEDFTLEDRPLGVPYSLKKLESGLPSDLLKRRPDIRRAERELAAATERVGQAQAEWFPSFSLLGVLGPEERTISKWFFDTGLQWLIGASVNWNFLTFGRISCNIEAKKSIERQALLNYCNVIIKALGDVETALVRYFDNNKRLTMLTAKLCAAITERDLIAHRWSAGIENQIDFLRSEKNRIMVEQEFTRTRQECSIALISVYKALGGGW